MTIILRLQGLDVKAGTGDIRAFFEHLHIPDGGVYIVGGSLREAFIAFTRERDAQLAMRHNGQTLKGSKVNLHISSMAELEEKLKTLLNRKKPSPAQITVRKPTPHANVPPLNFNTSSAAPPLDPDTANLQPSNAQVLDSSTAFLLGVCTVLQGLQGLQGENNEPKVDFPKIDSTVEFDEMRTPSQTLDSCPGYVRLFGLPSSATKEVICHFFKGLPVQEVIVNVELGRSHGCLVKFSTMQDASDALLFNQQSLGPLCVEVRAATEKMWTSAVQECEAAFDVEETVKPKQHPLRETANHKKINNPAVQFKRRSVNKLPYKPTKKARLDSDSTTLSPTMEHVVMVRNLPKSMTKTEIKELFGCPNLVHKNVLHLLDKEGNRTDTAFLIFNCTEDYDYAMNLTGCHVGSEAIEVTPTTRIMMRDMMDKIHYNNVKPCPKTDTLKKPNRKRILNLVETPEEARCVNSDPAAQTCLFVRNLPADVQERHIKRLFKKYKVRRENIVLLQDSNGKGIGEAVVQFKSQAIAALAQSLHGQDFLGTTVLLTCINVNQMEEILARNAQEI
ncbi:RNA binding motif protein 12Ba [Plectropomus leopardus]|uniref:RNA binding motif protein 12Ba n=1 Tax=Plectropomus leopardus TaxID=160734 RepID=UPI001C4BCF47|nr:RNA binding motif protein 12Ba [Plectropomus leopardus]XP_042345951.1 RNA binding motif protein 12Ba [Plectropomus leopardus]XP_042345954.1 RNA binding motif protein 12Ba [Plectropomus leopardus]XP_042345955.1 RNA binding motif protein 12Ba [Plectropomus leopardus]